LINDEVDCRDVLSTSVDFHNLIGERGGFSGCELRRGVDGDGTGMAGKLGLLGSMIGQASEESMDEKFAI
jgi:hypothetical protein